MTSSYDDQATFMPDSADSSDQTRLPDYRRATFPFAINSRYRCIELIGKGSSGAVYRAYDTQLQREVAIKFIHHDMLHERKRLLAEGRILAHLEHPNICHVFEVAEEGEAVYLVMSLIRGQPLNHWRDNLAQRQLIELTAQVCDAVAEAHRRGIVHCDIKPGNIVLQEDVSPLTAVLIDFGIAESRHNSTTSGAGTHHYMAPERFDANAPLTPAIDIFALGATLRMLLTGSHSNAGLDALGTDLKLIIEHCMAEDPTQRYASAAFIAQDLRAVLACAPISCRSGLGYRAVRLWQRSLWLRNTVWVSLFLSAGLLFTAAVYHSNMQERQIEEIGLHEQVTSLESQIDAIYRTPLHDASSSLDSLNTYTQAWVSRAEALPDWLAARHLAAAGRVQVKLGNINLAHQALTQAWQLGERSDSTAMALAIVYRYLYTDARAHAFNLPTAQARQQALDAAHQHLRQPALAYLELVEHSALPRDYIQAMRYFLEGDEKRAIKLLQSGDFPDWFYERYLLELHLIIHNLSPILLRRHTGDADPLVARFEELDEILRAYIPSSASLYTSLASTYLHISNYLPDDSERVSTWLNRARERLEYGLVANPTDPQLHRYMGNYLMTPIARASAQSEVDIIRRAVRHHELAIRYGYEQQLEPRNMTALYASYYNRLRWMQTSMINLGLSTQSLFHRSRVIGERIPPESQGAAFHANESRDYRYMAQHSHANERDQFWQMSIDAARNSYQIAPSIPTIQANSGIALVNRAVYLHNAEAIPVLEEALSYLEQAWQAMPTNGAIKYNYARAWFALSMRGELEYAKPALERAVEHLQDGMQNFPNLDFFNQLYTDILLFRPMLFVHQLDPLERIEKAKSVLDASSGANPGLGSTRYILTAYQRWRLTAEETDFEQLMLVIQQAVEHEFLRAYPYAAAVLFLIGEETLEQHHALVTQLIDTTRSSPIDNDTDPMLRLLQQLKSSMQQGVASEALVNLCDELRTQPIWLHYPVDKWQIAARLAQVAERDFAVRCLADDHPPLVIL